MILQDEISIRQQIGIIVSKYPRQNEINTCPIRLTMHDTAQLHMPTMIYPYASADLIVCSTFRFSVEAVFSTSATLTERSLQNDELDYDKMNINYLYDS